MCTIVIYSTISVCTHSLTYLCCFLFRSWSEDELLPEDLNHEMYSITEELIDIDSMFPYDMENTQGCLGGGFAPPCLHLALFATYVDPSNMYITHLQ